MSTFGPFDHYGVGDLDSCECWLCSQWRPKCSTIRLRAAQFEYGKCKCVNCTTLGPEKTLWRCLNYQTAHYDLLAVSNQRDLWIEMSYHAKHSKDLVDYGEAFMAWLKEEIERTSSRRGWWAVHAERLSLAFWFSKFEKQMGKTQVVHVFSKPKPSYSEISFASVA